jgi:glycine/serine hydroxymethyltransferase
MIDNVISDIDNEDLNNKVRKQVNEMMAEFPVFAW